MSQKNTYSPGFLRVTVNGLPEPPSDGGTRSTSNGMFLAFVGKIKLTAVWRVFACPVDAKPIVSPGLMTASDFSPVPATDSGTHPIEVVLPVLEHSNQLPGSSVAWNVIAGAAAASAIRIREIATAAYRRLACRVIFVPLSIAWRSVFFLRLTVVCVPHSGDNI